jgi:hypothetical protein
MKEEKKKIRKEEAEEQETEE